MQHKPFLHTIVLGIQSGVSNNIIRHVNQIFNNLLYFVNGKHVSNLYNVLKHDSTNLIKRNFHRTYINYKRS